MRSTTSTKKLGRDALDTTPPPRVFSTAIRRSCESYTIKYNLDIAPDEIDGTYHTPTTAESSLLLNSCDVYLFYVDTTMCTIAQHGSLV